MAGYKSGPDIDRVLSRLEIGDCWLWTLSADSKGYGQTPIGSTIDGTRRQVRVHRFVYESLVGKLPGRHIKLDHLCRVKLCANPDHLEPVTNQENTRRGRAGYGTKPWKYREAA